MFWFFLSTQGALRKPLTYDDHPIQSPNDPNLCICVVVLWVKIAINALLCKIVCPKIRSCNFFWQISCLVNSRKRFPILFLFLMLMLKLKLMLVGSIVAAGTQGLCWSPVWEDRPTPEIAFLPWPSSSSLSSSSSPSSSPSSSGAQQPMFHLHAEEICEYQVWGLLQIPPVVVASYIGIPVTEAPRTLMDK